MINPANEDIENWIFGQNVEVFFKIVFEEIQKNVICDCKRTL